MAPNEAMRRVIQTTQLTDDEIRHITRSAASDAERILQTMEPGVRKTQLELAKVNAEMWGAVGDATKIGIGDAVDSAATYQAMFDEGLLANVGIPQRYWHQSMLASARQGIESIISRKENGFTLSERVYRNQALAKGYVDDTVRNGLLLGKSQVEIARDVRKYIDPSTPGGASYAAMRLARTEVNNAYHQTAVRGYQKTPWVERVLWNLSGSHPVPDQCNEYAEAVTHRGWSAGQYGPDDVPSKPHPQCLCFVTPVMMDLDAYAKAFKQGKYDDYISNQMGCTRVA